MANALQTKKLNLLYFLHSKGKNFTFSIFSPSPWSRGFRNKKQHNVQIFA